MDICLERTYWHVDDKFFQQKYFNLVESCSAVVCNVFRDHLKKVGSFVLQSTGNNRVIEKDGRDLKPL